MVIEEANRGPDARLRENARALLARVERLPETLADIEAAADQLAQGGLKLDPESLRALGGQGRGHGWQLTALWIVVGLLVVLYMVD